MSSVIRSLVVKVGADLTDMQKGLKQASKELKSVGKSLTTTGTALTKGITLPAIAAATGLATLAIKSSETADDLKTMSAQTGISTQQLQKLQYASKFVDVEVETMAKGMAKVTKATGTATAKGEDFITVADGLSVSTKDSNGKLKDSEQIFYDTIDALGSMKDETAREVAAQNLFGKSYQDLMPLIEAGSGALEKYGDEAKKAGVIMSDQTVDSLANFNDTWERLKATISAAGTEIGAALVPVLEKLGPIIQDKVVPFVQAFIDKIAKLIDWFSNLDPKMQKIIGIIALMVVAIGPVLTVVGKMSTGIGGVIGGISKAIGIISGGGGIVSALGAIISPAGLVIAAIAAIAAAAFLIYKNWDKIKDFFQNLWEGVKSVTKSVVDFLVTLFLNFTPEGLIIKNWDKIVSYFSGLWDKVLNVFKKSLNEIIKLFNLIPGVDIPLFNVSTTKSKTAKSTAKSAKTTVAAPKTKKATSTAAYATGTNYVPQTGYALLHKGEAVIPASKNSGYVGSEITINNPLYLDGQILNRSNSRVQYGKNRSKARSLGVTT